MSTILEAIIRAEREKLGQRPGDRDQPGPAPRSDLGGSDDAALGDEIRLILAQIRQNFTEELTALRAKNEQLSSALQVREAEEAQLRNELQRLKGQLVPVSVPAGTAHRLPETVASAATERAAQLGLKYCSDLLSLVDPRVATIIPRAIMREAVCLPLYRTSSGAIVAAFADPECSDLFAQFEATLGADIIPVVAEPNHIIETINLI
ncbi:MAG: hypothetical protein GC168_02395 [Candidatus Hydrogenedens sp.]|nr:hypothetical protein [Candidatus Hydrogenedens sp.]